jgi:hypothetical protein
MNHVGHELKLNMEHVNAEANHTLDNLGIAKNAREEKIRARDEKMKPMRKTRAWPSSIASTSSAKSLAYRLSNTKAVRTGGRPSHFCAKPRGGPIQAPLGSGDDTLTTLLA